jgi:hypothetical protein
VFVSCNFDQEDHDCVKVHSRLFRSDFSTEASFCDGFVVSREQNLSENGCRGIFCF